MQLIRQVFIAALILVTANASAQRDSTIFDNLLIQALQGKMAPVLSALDTLEDAHLKKEQVNMKEVLLHRFREQREQYDFRTSDSSLIALMRIYHRYWRRALLDSTSWRAQDSALAEEVCAHLRRNRKDLPIGEPDSLAGYWQEVLQRYLQAHGYHSAVGKTGQFYDLLLHAQETAVHYPVVTPEDTLDVTVIFMDSVISNGWEGYATVDTYYPGGWATSDALYCSHNSYDLSSEDFAVSYLKHEGKHFADYAGFPALQSADLEYRAKLVELAAANTTLISTIRFFAQNSEHDPRNPHGLANFCVIRDLSRVLFQNEREEDIEAWRALPIVSIQHTAAMLLLKNTQDLQSAGASTVISFIH
jgi:hypothetical protein